MLWTKFSQVYFRSKTKEVNTTIEFCIFELVYVPNFILNLHFFIFWTKFTQKEYLQSKTEKVNTTIEFWLFKLV